MNTICCNANCAMTAVSVFSFTGLVRYFAGLFCDYRFYGKIEYNRLNRLLPAS